MGLNNCFLARVGRSGKSRAMLRRTWPQGVSERSCRLVGAAHRPPEGRSTPRSLPRPTTNISTTSPTRTSNKVRVAGPFTVESISPHRVLAVDENDEFIDIVGESPGGYDFAEIILDNLRTAGVQQAHKEDRISFTYLMPWPGRLVCAEGRYFEGGEEERHPAPRRHLHRPRVRHGLPPRPGRGRPRGRRRRLRRPHRLRLQLRGPHDRVRAPGKRSRAQGAHERGPAHGRGPEKHGARQPVCDLWRTGYYSDQWPVVSGQKRTQSCQLCAH